MLRKILISIFSLWFACSLQAQETNKTPLVYIIPVNKTIEPALLYVIRRGIDEAAREHADAIILKMDTTGGRVDSAIAIVSTIARSDIPVYTYVEKEAISAGAMIAISTSAIYMNSGSVIGDITPISMGMTGGVKDLPEAEKEKMTSYVAAHVRSAAEQGGHDPDLAEAMVRRGVEYKIKETIISKSGTVLTLTNIEAEQRVGDDLTPLLSQGTVNTIEDMLQELRLSGAKQKVMEVTSAERLARIIAALAPFLLMIGLGGLWLEIKTPGFGFFGIAGAACLILFFFGHHIAGLAGFEDIILLFIGITLLAIEIFIIPGFGIAGMAGITLIFLSLISMMAEHMPGKWRPISFEPATFSTPLFTVSGAFIGAVVLILIIGKFLPKTRTFHTLTLNETAPKMIDNKTLVGQKGVALSDLRPGGSAYFNDKKLNVVTRGDYIQSQSKICIVEVHGNRIVVETIS